MSSKPRTQTIYSGKPKTRKSSCFDSERTAHSSSLLVPENEQNFLTRNVRKGSAEVSSPTQYYKTEVCKFWGVDEPCPYGPKCVYAHGQAQIRSKDSLSAKYKTKNCRNFYENDYCPYGQRCQFIHTKPMKYRTQSTHFLQWFGRHQEIFGSIFNESKIGQEPRQPCQYVNTREGRNFLDEPPRFDEQDQMSQLLASGFTKPRLYSL